ncbi:response regulator [Agrobacterium larrymoorei]|uniref:response regulator n=1 Tax=Agrobacterium larrymoorei TaxID=160699 RepID=UPI0015746837|nr:response regulator [Agrobacterium larrymoorei]NTJ43905.1 response regulator [Agrobacterium larrymoorei]
MTHNTVLLVEDSIFVAIDLQMSLEDAGWIVAGPYASIATASAYLQNNLPSCAILDVNLIDGEVFAVADTLARANVPFVFHSGHADGAELAGRYPTAAFCPKPCLPRTLLRRIEAMVEPSERLPLAAVA